jgi:hypothetical protein
MDEFVHERLDVYRAAIEFLVLADAIASALPRGRAYLADQLRRASTSVSFNIAEGAGEYAPASIEWRGALRPNRRPSRCLQAAVFGRR